jgi:hypothetical protein
MSEKRKICGKHNEFGFRAPNILGRADDLELCQGISHSSETEKERIKNTRA